jgi:dTMP kinase
VSPLFITFEGLDGSGKSSHLRRVAGWLGAAAVPFVATKEPGGTPLGEALRELFLDPRWGRLDGGVEMLLVFASRRQHLLEVIEPALAAGRHVLCDRFTDSTHAYQGAGRGVPEPLIDAVDEIATGRRRPDRTLLFDLDPAEARSRVHRPRTDRVEADRLDREELAFYQRVRAGFLARAAAEPERFRIIPTADDREVVAAAVRAALADLLPATTGPTAGGVPGQR